jgi:hypothetical protein
MNDNVLDAMDRCFYQVQVECDTTFWAATTMRNLFRSSR